MKTNYFLLLVAIITANACSKSKQSNADCDEFFVSKMSAEWGVKPDCETISHGIYTSLMKGRYRNETVYYTLPTGPGLIAANTAPLEYVVTCSEDSIKIDANTKIEYQLPLAQSCE